MNLALTGSIAYDYLMTFPGRFRDHILPDRLDRLSLSFLVDTLDRRRGGIAANIAYTMALLGERPMVMATVGEDFEDYRAGLAAVGVDTSHIRTVDGLLTASFFVNTDQTNAQIASFYTGAMSRASELKLADLTPRPDLVMISANDPRAMTSYVLECRQLGIPYAYDPSQQVVRMEASALRQDLMGCASAFGNDYEFALIKEKAGLTPSDLLQHAEFVVVTLGEIGVDIHTREGVIRIPPVHPTAIADPTGVGDALRAGFLAGLMHGFSLERCGQMGALTATYCLEARGTQCHSFDLPSFIRRFRQCFDDQGDLDRLG